jgi:hypothetical protein
MLKIMVQKCILADKALRTTNSKNPGMRMLSEGFPPSERVSILHWLLEWPFVMPECFKLMP